MIIDFDKNVRPFFQVLVKKVSKDITALDFFKKFKEVIIGKNENSFKHRFEIKQPATLKEVEEKNFLAVLLKHSQVPTWYSQEEKIDLASKPNILLDVEHDLLVFYRNSDFVFLHTNCNQIFSLIIETQEQLFVDDGIKFKKLDGDQLSHILTQFKIEYRSLGLQNHFGLGGTAPDGKTYYGRDTSNSLTPSFDAGYGFSYCIGAMLKDDGGVKPFGCSKSKSKIWSTWVEDLNILCEQCDEIVRWLDSPIKEINKLDVLVESTSKAIIGSLTPVEFFLDYYQLEKGTVFLGNSNSLSLDWTCHFEPADTSIIFEVRLDDELYQSKVFFKYNTHAEVYEFSYDDEKLAVNIAVNENIASVTDRTTYDLVEFLNKQHHFTVLFDQPYAYRDEECWLDNRLKKVFLSSSGMIDWSKVDIRKENLAAPKGKINILQQLDKKFRADKNIIFSCIDNGANEIADYIALYENKIILIHAKYSSSDKPGLLIGDVQVVASQTIKNIRFFMRQAYTDSILQRLYKNATDKRKFKTFDSFKNTFLKIVQSKETTRECWIVQPGISLPKLRKDTTNKMHTILNFIESVLRVNNIGFTLYGNAK